MPLTSSIRLGPAGWSYPDWKGPVYPRRSASHFDDLRFLSQFVDFVEVNSTFYAALPPGTGIAWDLRLRSAPKFQFAVKAWQRLTHGTGGPATRNEIDTWSRLPLELRDAGRLLAVLAQYPGSFRDCLASRSAVLHLRDRLRFLEVPLAVEVRHAEFGSDIASEWFEREELCRVQVDLPPSAAHLSPVVEPTNPLRYVRLHGRNAEAWWKAHVGRDARYDYLYGRPEVSEWAERIRAHSTPGTLTLVVANNHFQGKAMALVAELAAALSGERVSVIESLCDRYPQLLEIALPPSGSLFR